MNKLDKMCYSEFIEYLENKKTAHLKCFTEHYIKVIGVIKTITNHIKNSKLLSSLTSCCGLSFVLGQLAFFVLSIIIFFITISLIFD